MHSFKRIPLCLVIPILVAGCAGRPVPTNEDHHTQQPQHPPPQAQHATAHRGHQNHALFQSALEHAAGTARQSNQHGQQVLWPSQRVGQEQLAGRSQAHDHVHVRLHSGASPSHSRPPGPYLQIDQSALHDGRTYAAVAAGTPLTPHGGHGTDHTAQAASPQPPATMHAQSLPAQSHAQRPSGGSPFMLMHYTPQRTVTMDAPVASHSQAGNNEPAVVHHPPGHRPQTQVGSSKAQSPPPAAAPSPPSVGVLGLQHPPTLQSNNVQCPSPGCVYAPNHRGNLYAHLKDKDKWSKAEVDTWKKENLHKPRGNTSGSMKCPEEGCSYAPAARWSIGPHLGTAHGWSDEAVEGWKQQNYAPQQRRRNEGGSIKCPDSGCTYTPTRKRNIPQHLQNVHKWPAADVEAWKDQNGL